MLHVQTRTLDPLLRQESRPALDHFKDRLQSPRCYRRSDRCVKRERRRSLSAAASQPAQAEPLPAGPTQSMQPRRCGSPGQPPCLPPEPLHPSPVSPRFRNPLLATALVAVGMTAGWFMRGWIRDRASLDMEHPRLARSVAATRPPPSLARSGDGNGGAQKSPSPGLALLRKMYDERNENDPPPAGDVHCRPVHRLPRKAQTRCSQPVSGLGTYA